MKFYPEKIGNFIARGGSCFVYLYGKNHVVKKYFLSLFLGESYTKKLKEDYEICKKYFGKLVITTHFFVYKKQPIEIQKFITGKPLRKNCLKNKKVKQQFLEIIQILKVMKGQEIAPIDLIGFG